MQQTELYAHFSAKIHLLYAGKRVKFGNYFFDRATNSISAVVKNVRQSYMSSSQ
jgi:hypothetical protein